MLHLLLRDAAGNPGYANASIVLDTVAPTGAIAITGGAKFVRSTTVSVDVTPADAGMAAFSKRASTTSKLPAAAKPKADPGMRMCVSASLTCSAWVAGAARASVVVPAGDGVKTIYLWLEDSAGNRMANPASVRVTLDTTKPLVTTFKTWSGATIVSSPLVRLAVGVADFGSGVTKM